MSCEPHWRHFTWDSPGVTDVSRLKVARPSCGSFGIFLLAACGFDVPEFWDIALTGLAIGSGTKPLHDLIGNIQKAGNERSDPPQAVTTE
jgi:hypothetical protein